MIFGFDFVGSLWEMIGIGFAILDWVSGGEIDLEKSKRCEKSVRNKNKGERKEKKIRERKKEKEIIRERTK